MKAIIAIFYPSRVRPGKYGDFLLRPEFGCYVWKGRVFDLDTELKEFHEKADKVLGFSDAFPRPVIRLLPEKNSTLPALAGVPIGDLVEAYRLRNREARIYQLAQARAEKLAKKKPASPAPRDEDADLARMENEGGVAKEPALAA